MANSSAPFRRTALHLAISIAAGAACTLAQAQSPQSRAQLEEVVVTATKREANVQDISVSVTALGKEELMKGGIDDISRLEHLVPGMRFGQSGNEARLAIRGTRTNNVGTEAEQVVGIFEDGVYVPTTTQALGSYVDLNRVEVLRGPQGTLYGRNTFGGAINVVTNEPDFEKLGGYAHALYGDYDRTRVEGAVNVPVSDTLALRVVGLQDQHDGYIENTYRSGASDDLNDQDIQFVRASIKWAPTENFDATLRAVYSDQQSTGSAIWGYQQIGGFVDGNFLEGHQYAPANASADFDNGPWEVRRNMRSNAEMDSTALTLSTNWDVGFATLRFIGNTTDYDGEQNYDPDYSDGGSDVNSGFTGWTSEQDTWSTEVQLLSNGDGALSWMLGYYYYEQTSNWNWLERVNDQVGVPHWDNQGDYTSDSTGYFANATYALTNATRLNAGARYAEDTKQQRDQLDWSVFPPVAVPGTGSEGEWDDWLYKAGVEHDLNDDMMAYGTVSTGYRAGGINFIAAGVPLTYDPEEVTAYEIGLKSTLADGALTLNVAAYYNEYREMQAQSFVDINGFVSEFTENGGEIDAKGLEAEISWVPAANWHVDASFAWMDAEFGQYQVSRMRGLGNIPGRQDMDKPNGLLNLNGWRPALSPELSAGLQLSYDIHLGNGSTLTPYFQSTYTDEYYAADINVEGTQQDAHTKSDVRLIWVSPSGSIEVQGFVLNIEDEEVLNRVVIFAPSERPELASLQANWNNPQTWGVAATYNF